MSYDQEQQIGRFGPDQTGSNLSLVESPPNQSQTELSFDDQRRDIIIEFINIRIPLVPTTNHQDETMYIRTEYALWKMGRSLIGPFCPPEIMSTFTYDDLIIIAAEKLHEAKSAVKSLIDDNSLASQVSAFRKASCWQRVLTILQDPDPDLYKPHKLIPFPTTSLPESS